MKRCPAGGGKGEGGGEAEIGPELPAFRILRTLPAAWQAQNNRRGGPLFHFVVYNPALAVRGKVGDVF